MPTLLFQTLFCLLCVLQTNAFAYSYRIIKTPIFHFTRAIKQHHIVIIQPVQIGEKKKNRLRTYAVDYTPIKQNWKTTLQLFLGMSVPAKIRVLFLAENVCLNCDTDEEIEEKWKNANIEVHPVELFPPILKLKEQSKWRDPQQMNLYRHNCQHFSDSIVSIL